MFRSHSGIHILSLVVFSAGIPFASMAAKGLSGIFLLVALALGGTTLRTQAWLIVRRMRVLLFSLGLLYGWFTPGMPLVAELGDWSPTREGLALGGVHVLSLLLIGVAVAMLLAATVMSELVAGLLWVLAPARFLRLPLERLALRIALTLQAVTELRASVSAPLKDDKGDKVGRLADALFTRFEEVLYRAELTPPTDIEVERCPSPAWYHWLIPLCVAGIVLVV